MDRVVHPKVQQTLTVMLSITNMNASSRAIEHINSALIGALIASVTTSVVATTRPATTTARAILTVGPDVPAQHMTVAQIPIQLTRVPRTGQPMDLVKTTQNGHFPMPIWQNSIVDELMPGSCRNPAAQIAANLTKRFITVNRVLLLIREMKIFSFLNLLVFQITMLVQNHPRKGLKNTIFV